MQKSRSDPILWASVWLTVIFIATKAYYLAAATHDRGSSFVAYLTPPVVFGLIGVPSMFLALVWISVRQLGTQGRVRPSTMAIAALVWIAAGYVTYRTTWSTRQERAIAETPPGVFLSSW